MNEFKVLLEGNEAMMNASKGVGGGVAVDDKMKTMTMMEIRHRPPMKSKTSSR